ncbi:hypothetical protein CLOLEP_01083 [[Clostridium] leptum DSM 753]|uniref:Uncharacterized protein n=1 Tax=[Clostridium] leptum DSM 753 TaxID=428125 RepID=A7VRA0_9FIRM|nr:hypothetical protein CLOLEP_01083 [[Clostridium] leptum DSM 753]
MSGKTPSERLLPSLAALFSHDVQHAEASKGARPRDKSEILKEQEDCSHAKL